MAPWIGVPQDQALSKSRNPNLQLSRNLRGSESHLRIWRTPLKWQLGVSWHLVAFSELGVVVRISREGTLLDQPHKWVVMRWKKHRWELQSMRRPPCKKQNCTQRSEDYSPKVEGNSIAAGDNVLRNVRLTKWHECGRCSLCPEPGNTRCLLIGKGTGGS